MGISAKHTGTFQLIKAPVNSRMSSRTVDVSLRNSFLSLCLLLCQSREFSAKKPNKTPVKQNGPAGKASGSAVKPQIKVWKD